MRSRGESKTRWMAIVSSTTPRLGPRWPPTGAQAGISRSRISLARVSSSSSESRRRSCGPEIVSSTPMDSECTESEPDERDRRLLQAAQPDPALVLADAGHERVVVGGQVEVVDQRA